MGQQGTKGFADRAVEAEFAEGGDPGDALQPAARARPQDRVGHVLAVHVGGPGIALRLGADDVDADMLDRMIVHRFSLPGLERCSLHVLIS